MKRFVKKKQKKNKETLKKITETRKQNKQKKTVRHVHVCKCSIYTLLSTFVRPKICIEATSGNNIKKILVLIATDRRNQFSNVSILG